MLTITYCEHYRKEIGEFAFCLFAFICEEFYKKTPLEISTNMQDDTTGYLVIIRFLEKKGFIVTTESGKDLIQVKPLGLSCINNSYTRVCRFCVHDKIDWD